MATLTAYPTNNVPKISDLLLGTKVATLNTEEQPTTTNITVGSLASLINTGFAGGYTVYTALLTQQGNQQASTPAAIVLQDTLVGTITWTRTGVGAYTATIAGGFFTLNKTMVFINNGSASSTNNIEWASPTTATVTIDTSADSVLTAASLEIRIYL